MNDMFNGCESLNNIDISNWDTSKLENMNNLFNGCISLSEVDLNYIIVQGHLGADNISNIFTNCNGIKTVGLGAFNKDQVDIVLTSLPSNKEITVQLSDTVIAYYENTEYLTFDRFFNIEKITSEEDLYFFGIYETLSQFSLRGYPKVNGYFIVGTDIKLYYDNHVYPIRDGIYIGTFNKLEDITKVGYVVMYEDLYFRGWDNRKASLKGMKYGDKNYHVLSLESWEKICDSINALKNISNDSLDDSITSADKSWTSLKIKEQLEATIKDVKAYIDEVQKNKITIAYAHNCPTESKMVENRMYITPVFKNENEISHYERFIKINDVKYELGECGHSNDNYYTKEKADAKYKFTDIVAMDGNLGVLNSTASQILNGTKKVNRRTVATSKAKNTEIKFYDVDDDNFVGQIRYRVINGFKEVLFELKSKGVEATYANTDEYHGAVIEPTEDIFELPTLNCGDDDKLNNAYVNGYMKIIDWPDENEDSLEVLDWHDGYYHEENRAMLLEDDNRVRYGSCFINGNKLYIIADLTQADVTYSGYIIYPVWGNEVN
jgi:surface protein